MTSKTFVKKKQKRKLVKPKKRSFFKPESTVLVKTKEKKREVGILTVVDFAKENKHRLAGWRKWESQSGDLIAVNYCSKCKTQFLVKGSDQFDNMPIVLGDLDKRCAANVP